MREAAFCVRARAIAQVAVKVLESKELEDDELYEALRMEITLLRQASTAGPSPEPHASGEKQTITRQIAKTIVG